MTAVHRPLSGWVRAASPGPGGAWTPSGPLNDGDERADARGLPRFASGWERGALAMAGGGHALALTQPATGAAVLELDDLGQPLPVSPATAGAVASVERRWPAVRLEPAEAELLGAAHPELRFGLLDRLAAEGRPEPESFHILPWELVDRLTVEVTAALDMAAGPGEGGPRPGPPVRLRHWFSPTGSRFTAALEQLDAALRAADTPIRRVATTALCERLAEAAADRIPAPTRRRLAGLLDAVGRADVYLSATSALAADRLTRAAPEPGAPGTTEATGATGGSAAGYGREAVVWRTLRYGPPASVQNMFAPAATDEAETVEDEVVRAAFTLTLTLDSDGGLYLSVAAPLDPASARLLAEGYGEVMLLPVRLTGAAEATEVYVLLRPGRGGLAGDLELSVAGADTEEVTADQAGPPLGLADLPRLDPAAVRATQRCLVRVSDREAWLGLLEQLPAGHPVRRAAEEG
ncbi:hypothetical protein [Streptomyces sp. NPDC047014]|uniref:hypothetical protein n=1 Tax=Streptomyces sp. NPDC047014 TaxID=3155736 RepID=UPI0033D117C5